MDPWTNHQNTIDNLNCSQLLEFEDNFAPQQSNKLPDSEKYLQILETKLDKIKNDPNLLQQLKQKREAVIEDLLKSENFIENSDEQLELPIDNLEIYRRILPQKQALNRGEIVEFIHYDQLDNDNADTK